MATCPKCGGSGDVAIDRKRCEGTGEVYSTNKDGNTTLVTCPSCRGAGVQYKICSRCNGSGEV